ncbi:U3 small nucleolar RNA-associated protein 14 homolog A [Rhynochetos jubatus]
MAEDGLGVEAAGSDGEDEGQEDGERRHRRLLEAVSALAGRKRRKLAERTEASGRASEFNVSCAGAGEKLVLRELLPRARPAPALSSVRRELAGAKRKKAAEPPLSKEEAKRVVREAAYVGTARDVGRWQQVVVQNRRAEQLLFPLRQEIATVAPLEQVVSAWKARTPLEQEIFGLLRRTQQPITDPLLTPEETALVQAMSLEEAQQRRAELQKARAVQSYYEAKARREKKIKSKKYHRVLKKSRRRKALKEFELLHRADPEAALARLEELEQLRMQERMSLKHQNKGKWARSRAVMAKYDLEARRAMQEQLAKNKELTQKVRLALPEEEPGAGPEEDLAPGSSPAGPAGADGANPWMLGRPSSPAAEPEAQQGLGDVAVPGAEESQGEPEQEEEMSEEEALLQDFAQQRHARRQRAGSPAGHGAGESEAGREVPGAGAVCAEGQAGAGAEGPAREEILLSEQLSRVRTMEDVEALASEEPLEERETPAATRAETRAETRAQQQEGRAGGKRAEKPPGKKGLISLQAVLARKAAEAPCPSLPVLVEEEEGGTDQRGVITEAFAGDDVVADFRREKRKAEEATKPRVVNLVLPGWGEWGGVGLEPSARKRKRFLLKPPPAPPRKDQHLPHVIISERRNIHAAAHQVSELPFPFERHQQFEQSIRTPLGPTWNTQRAFQKLTAPRVLTRAGHIIQPISPEDVAPANAAGAQPALEAAPRRQERPPRRPRGRAP